MLQDRIDAGKKLAALLHQYRDQKDAIILALPRGGVVVASEIAKALRLPLDVICPRKLGSPGNPELAIGAVTEDGQGYYNEDLIMQLAIPKDYLVEERLRQLAVAKERLSTYRRAKPALEITAKTVLLVDDGLATGATMKAAILSINTKAPKKIVVVVPVAPPSTAAEIKKMCDEFICLLTTASFQAVGQFYNDFKQTSDDEVIQLLQEGIS